MYFALRDMLSGSADQSSYVMALQVNIYSFTAEAHSEGFINPGHITAGLEADWKTSSTSPNQMTHQIHAVFG